MTLLALVAIIFFGFATYNLNLRLCGYSHKEDLPHDDAGP